MMLLNFGIYHMGFGIFGKFLLYQCNFQDKSFHIYHCIQNILMGKMDSKYFWVFLMKSIDCHSVCWNVFKIFQNKMIFLIFSIKKKHLVSIRHVQNFFFLCKSEGLTCLVLISVVKTIFIMMIITFWLNFIKNLINFNLGLLHVCKFFSTKIWNSF